MARINAGILAGSWCSILQHFKKLRRWVMTALVALGGKLIIWCIITILISEDTTRTIKWPA